MSKQNRHTHPGSPLANAGVEYWLRRLYRNTYTRGGRSWKVRNWAVKIQHRGVRRTFSLGPPDHREAAKEAMSLHQTVVGQGWDAALDVHRESRGTRPSPGQALPGAANPPTGTPARPRLLQRPQGHAGAPVEAREWIAHVAHAGRRYYFPLETTDPIDAARRSRRIQQALQREGMAGVGLRFPRELTVGIHWANNPVTWTYFTMRTRPGVSAAARKPGLPARALPVALVEPDPGVSDALRDCLEAQPGIACVARFAQPLEALLWLGRNRVALLLVDQELGEISGDGLLGRVRHVAAQLPGLVYSIHDDSDELFKSTPGGAVGYLLKRTPSDRPLEPIAGLRPVPWPTATQIAERSRSYFQRLIGSTPALTPRLESSRLTARELEILSLISRGFLDKEVAHALHISGWTVHGHVKRIYEKLGVHSRTEAAVRYLQK